MAEVTEYRGFAVELREERAGRPVYPIWRDLDVPPAQMYPDWRRWVSHVEPE